MFTLSLVALSIKSILRPATIGNYNIDKYEATVEKNTEYLISGSALSERTTETQNFDN